MKYLKFFEDLNPVNKPKIVDNDYRIVYRAGKGYHNGMFFSEEKEYAEIFAFSGDVFKYRIFTGKVLNLKKYNEEVKKEIMDMNNIDMHRIYNRLFQMHSDAIERKWNIYTDNLYIVGLGGNCRQIFKRIRKLRYNLW